jgi:hypothetical protein
MKYIILPLQIDDNTFLKVWEIASNLIDQKRSDYITVNSTPYNIWSTYN